jgi:hypothetical protein
LGASKKTKNQTGKACSTSLVRHAIFSIPWLAKATVGIFENIIGVKPELSSHLVEKTALMKWLLVRMQGKLHDANRGYAAELLVILLQNNRANRSKFAAADGIETLLTVAAVGNLPAWKVGPSSWMYSNFASGIRPIRTRWSSWRTSSTPCALRSASRRSRSFS